MGQELALVLSRWKEWRASGIGRDGACLTGGLRSSRQDRGSPPAVRFHTRQVMQTPCLTPESQQQLPHLRGRTQPPASCWLGTGLRWLRPWVLPSPRCHPEGWDPTESSLP